MLNKEHGMYFSLHLKFLICLTGDSISNNQLETNNDSLVNSTLGSKIVSSIALTKPLTSEQQKKRAAMLFGNSSNMYLNKIPYIE